MDKSSKPPHQKSSETAKKSSSQEIISSDKEVIFPQKRGRDVFIKEIGDSSPPENISVLLAKNWDNSDSTGWWISEKLDGVRCYWNGKNMLSRQGNKYTPPSFFTEGLPKTVSLDGELWLGRQRFQECVSIARCTDNGKNDMTRWHNMTYRIFDAPSLDLPFELRLDYIKGLVNSDCNRYIRYVDQTKCESIGHMIEELEKVEKQGGEGLMLREPQSYYEGKRSSTLLKVKSFKDAEATIIGYEKGKGKYERMVGALRVRNEDGVEFKLGSGLTDADRRNPPAIGSKVTYKYQELSKDGVPRFPTYHREHPGI